MKTMVCFRTSEGRFALPIESTVSVTTTDGLVDLPEARADVIGMLPCDPPLTVLASLGTGDHHVLVVESRDARYGLHVLEVLGVRRFDDDQVGPAPKGQEGGLISGTLGGSEELTLVVDAEALAARL
ncbi:MAG: chemotaxis protein CheW [Ilumatobacteraceae bacterium]